MVFVTVNFLKSLDEWKILFKINFFIGFIVGLIALSQYIGIPFNFLNFLPITITYLPVNESYPGFGKAAQQIIFTSQNYNSLDIEDFDKLERLELKNVNNERFPDMPILLYKFKKSV